MRGSNHGVLSQLFGSIGLRGRSLSFFLVIALLGVGGFYIVRHPLSAAGPVNPSANQIDMTLNPNGNLYLGSVRLPAEVFTGNSTYRYRYQVINQPQDFIDTLTIDLTLPQPATTQQISYRLISNGGAGSATAVLINPTTVEYIATGISTQSQLSIEIEVPRAFVTQSFLFKTQQQLANLPTIDWLGVSIGLPALAVLILLIVGFGRIRHIEPASAEVNQLPSRLPPAILGILWRGRLTNRELAATLLDLARRGHLVIRQVSERDFRFRRLDGGDELNDYEAELLTQIFGPSSDQTNTEEISLALAQEVFSKRVSQSFILAYKKISDLGYFYTNPLALHRRYQISGIVLFVVGAAGFAINLFLITSVQYSLFFWAGMMAAALAITYFARGLPVRTIYGDREVSKWLAFRRYLTAKEPINYVAHSQEQFLAFLPYAVVFEVEREWTSRFYDMPFVQPSWYVAPNISTIDDFANQIFPLFGYLSHALALTAQPASQ